MSKLIRADLRRILKKVNVWVLFIISALLSASAVFTGKSLAPKWNGYVFLTMGIPTSGISLLISLAVLLGVFGDDHKSGALSTVIGRGFSRSKVVFAKFLDSVILLFGMFFVLTFMDFVLSIILGAPMTALETKAFLLEHFINACTILGTVTLSALLLYLTNSMPLTIIMTVVTVLMSSTLKGLLNTMFLVKRYNLTRYDLSGFLRNAYSDFILGMTWRGIISFVMGMVIYVGGALLLSQLIFNYKELDF